MNTPICDFIQSYHAAGTIRFHMPGHKGVDYLGCEHLDLTEIQGADSLYEADGIIAQSEANATALFGSARTVYSTEGSSQCIRAMLYLALANRKSGSAPLIVAARNVHKTFVYAGALLDFQVQWLWPEGENYSLCGCQVSAEALERCLKLLPDPPAAVYITSPDYLGNVADIAALSEVCHRYGTLLAVDNAHGAYLRFLRPSLHPLDLGADLCCDSAHKTFPVLTGGAYLHLGKRVPAAMLDQVKPALALFGSTSPSYLILASLDRCNRYLEENYPSRLLEMCQKIQKVREDLTKNGWDVEKTDPLRLTIAASPDFTGIAMGALLRQHKIECEYADPQALVMMLTPENSVSDLQTMVSALGKNSGGKIIRENLPVADGTQVVSIRQAFFAAHEVIQAKDSFGRICGAPTVACPPAVPIAISGERIGTAALILFEHYGIETVDVLK